MGIKDGEHKMSKSEPDGCLFLTDEPEEIKKKVLKARTDGIDGIDYDLKKRKSLSNLIQILALVRNTPGMALAEELSHLDHLQFKMILADELAKYFMNYRERYKSIDKIEVEDVLEVGTLAASKIASSKLQQYVSIYNK
jgi:tryptophanyl-tRNA synthetase